MTLLELLAVVAMIVILAGIAIPAYHNYVEKAHVSAAIADITGLEGMITDFYADSGRHPNDLGELKQAGLLDPWGNPYQYINIAEAGPKVKCRKDHNLHPINSDYDLYSMGKDGQSALPLTAKSSQDDIIRANDGKYVGLASGY